MASSKHLVLLSLCVITSILVHPSSCDEPKQRLYVFGDSRFDAGNFVYQNPSSEYGKWPYGMSLTSASLAYGMGRKSDGLLLPDFIASYAKLGLIPAALKADANLGNGANFAYRATNARSSTARNLRQQQKHFMSVVQKSIQDIGVSETREVLKRSVFLFNIGRTDYLAYSGGSAQTAKIAFVNLVIRDISSVLQDIYKEGGRKFAFQNMEPLGCIPFIKQSKNLGGDQCDPQLMDLARLHNNALLKELTDLSIRLPEFKYSVFDQFTAINERLKNPEQYGFVDGARACCGSGEYRGSGCGSNAYDLCSIASEHLYFDGQGVSQAGEYQLAALFWSGGQDVVQPYNLRQFFEPILLQDC